MERSRPVEPVTSSPPFPGSRVITDGNESISRVAYKSNGGLVIYTITPSSPFGEESAKMAARGEKNLYGVVPQVFMASDEAAAASFVQGMAAKGVGSATCSSSQGILLMIPEMYNAAGQLLPVSFYIGARDLSRHSLTIFAGHSDVYAVRDTGICILFSRDAQELQDLGAIAERLKWEVSLPVAVVYDGFLTTHKQTQINELSESFFWEFLPHERMIQHKSRSLDPAHPTVWGTNENPDGYMQACLAQRPHADAVAQVLPRLMAEFEQLTGRSYAPYGYAGHPDATDVIVAAGSSVSTISATIRHLLREDPERRIGVVDVRAFRPFLVADFLATLPHTVERIAVLDRSVNHTLQDEPLCADVRSAVVKGAQGFPGLPRLARLPIVTGGMYGVGGKDFHPGHVVSVLNHLAELERSGQPWTGFSVGVVDDINHTSLPTAPTPDIFGDSAVHQARIVAYGSDGTVSMVKAAAKIYSAQSGSDGEDIFIASHAEYDSKKAGGVTVSHLRVSSEPFEECFDIQNPDYVAVHHPALLGKRRGILGGIRQGGTFVVNTSLPPEMVFAALPAELQLAIQRRKLEVYAIDAFRIAAEHDLGNKISMIMQRVLLDHFGPISGEDADRAMESGIRKTFARKGPEVIERNIAAFHRAVDALLPVPVPSESVAVAEHQVEAAPAERARTSLDDLTVPRPDEQAFRDEIQEPGMAGQGDSIPVSAYFDHARGGARPVNTWKGLSRSFATELPTFYPWLCNGCGGCVYSCPTGGALDQAVLGPELQRSLSHLPLSRVFRDTGGVDLDPTDSIFQPQQLGPDEAYGLAVDPNLCTGCGVCEASCAKDAIKLHHVTAEYYDWLKQRREILDAAVDAGGGVDLELDLTKQRHTQPEMEALPNYLGASGACAGCYEPLYVSKFLQLYPHTVISNATGCSSIWGAQAYETPYGTDETGCGPAWVNPLFENNAAVGGGIALGVDQEAEQMEASAEHVLQALLEDRELADRPVFATLAQDLREFYESRKDKGTSLADRFDRVRQIQRIQATLDTAWQQSADQPVAFRTHLGLLRTTITSSLDKTTLIVGGDGWAFDIGLQMMLHVLQSDLDLVVMVLVTDVYSNTGGQMSKATPMGMDAPFAPGGKLLGRFPLGLSVAYGNNAYVARVNLAYPNHMDQAYKAAEEFPGPAILFCYVPCMTAHKFPATGVFDQARRATTSRYWPLWSYDPRSGWNIAGNPESKRLVARNEGDFIDDFCRKEGRFRSQFDADGEPSPLLLAQRDDNLRIWALLQQNAAASSES
ncbi:MAG TPA: 2-oxoacid:acceptor oxidoreductase family protein [Myxococcota bacterium]|nr:2-oxoacid:acceptor oxidoreductase family protein [Myxococcota bacterium]